MKKITCIIILLLTVSTSGVTQRMAKTSGVYQSLRYEATTQKLVPNNCFILILNKSGTFIDAEYTGRFTGTWRFVQKDIVELTYIPLAWKEDMIQRLSIGYRNPQFLDHKIEILNKDTLRINQTIFVRIQ